MKTTGEFLDATLGETEGYAAAPTLTGGEWVEINGTMKNPTGQWRERFFAWPAQRDKLIEHIERFEDRDVYLCPNVLPSRSRKKGDVPDVLQVIHGDADGGVELSVIQGLGAGAVCSGRDGHYHVYALLTDPVTLKQHRVLEEGLRAKVHGDDKISPNDVLRPVGGINRKTDPPGEVTVVSWPDERITPHELAHRLGVDLDGEPKSKERKPQAERPKAEASEPTPDEPADLSAYPPEVAAELAIDTGDRSKDTYRVLGRCRDSGLDLEQSRAVIRSRADLRQRLDARDDDDVAASWERLAAADNKSWQQKAKQKAEEQKAEEPKPDGAEVLDRVAAWFRRFITFTADQDADIVTLWASHTWLAKELRISPRLALDSIVFGSGKTTLLEHLKALCCNGVLTVGATAAVIPRLVHIRLSTLLFDEIDRTLAPGKDGVDDLVAIINSGHRLGSSRTVLVQTQDGWVPEEMSTFAPVALSGNSPLLPGDTMSRSLRILLMPDLSGEAEDTDWPMIEAEAKQLATDLKAWADSVRETISITGVTVEGARGRELERWRTLKTVAYAAGGHWKQTVDDLIAHGLAEAKARSEAGINTVPARMQLLVDLHRTWEGQPEFISTADLCARLVCEHPGYWGENSGYGRELTPQRLGKMLADATKMLSAQEASQRPDTHGPRGYSRLQFVPTWHRLGFSTPPQHSDHSAQPDHSDHADAESDPSAPSDPVDPSTGERGGGKEKEKDWPMCAAGCGDRINPVFGDTHSVCQP